MNRIIFIVVLLLPFFILGYLFPDKFPHIILPVLIVIYIPVLTILRMKYIKMSWKEILISMIPFYGYSKQIKIFTKK